MMCIGRLWLLIGFVLHCLLTLAQSGSARGVLWTGSVGCLEYLTAPVQILDFEGPSPSFIPKWQRGWGLDLTLGRSIGKHGRFLARGVWDRIPIGYATDVEPDDHPALGINYSIASLNSTHWSRRISVGLSYRYGFELSAKSILELGVGILHNTNHNNYPYRVGEGAITDSTVYWIIGLQTRVFSGSSPWHGRGEVQFTRRVFRNHALTLAYYVDLPFSDVYTEGSAILLGNTQYQTTLTFRQSGFI